MDRWGGSWADSWGEGTDNAWYEGEIPPISGVSYQNGNPVVDDGRLVVTDAS